MSATPAPRRFDSGLVRVVESASAELRLREAKSFVAGVERGVEVLLVGASRGAVDDLARAIALEKGATFGLHRFSFTQLASRIAAADLAARDLTAITSLGHEAVAARAVFEAIKEENLAYFAPVSSAPGFPKALARTLLELRLGEVAARQLGPLGRSGPDLAALLERVDSLLAEASASDRALLFETATRVLRTTETRWSGLPLLLLDVPFESKAEAEFLSTLVEVSAARPGTGGAGLQARQAPPKALRNAAGKTGSPRVLVIVPFEDQRTLGALEMLGAQIDHLDEAGESDLVHARRHLFSRERPPLRERAGEVVFFSAPGEGRECVEMARFILREAERGVRFDEMAILLRSPQEYLGLLEHALDRARIPGYFDRGTRRPDPAGRAFVAVLGCAVENFSAKRFAEYLSLGQVPQLDAAGAPPTDRAMWVPPQDADQLLPAAATATGQLSLFDLIDRPAPGSSSTEARAPRPNLAPGSDSVLSPQSASLSRPQSSSLSSSPEPPGPSPDSEAPDSDAEPVVAGTLRAPWKWEHLLVESAVIGGRARWERRLNGLAEEYRLKIEELAADEPESPHIPRLQRELKNLEHLRAFALPLIDMMSDWPERAKWGDWLVRLEALAARVLRWPAHVLRVIADLRPMAEVGPVTFDEVRDVVAERLRTLDIDPPDRRYGRVFVGSPHQARGRAFKVVFVPGLAERMFPQKLRQDPLLLDELRAALNAVPNPESRIPNPDSSCAVGSVLSPQSSLLSGPRSSSLSSSAKARAPRPGEALRLPIQDDRSSQERLLLRLAIGAATDRLYISYPRIETAESRPRVPSFYLLDLWRAITGRIPDYRELESVAASATEATLAWPAPPRPEDAIDNLEHDLAVLRGLLRSPDETSVKGRAHYMLRLNDCLRRSVTERWARARSLWSPYDGIVRVADGIRPMLASQRLGARPYSLSALQRYATCPYQFLLSAIYRLSPYEPPEPLQRMDPLTKGSLFHRAQAEFFRALQREGLLPFRPEARGRVLAVLDETIQRVAAEYRERLAPAIERVWQDEIASMHTDLRIWADALAAGGEWEPWLFEFAFGLPGEPGRDPNSRDEPVLLDGRFVLRGSVDLVERKPGTQLVRVTDHKTSKNRTKRETIIGGGTLLQPVLYSLIVEAATGCTAQAGRFSFCTTAGNFSAHEIPINERTRRLGLEALEIVDRAVELGFLAPAPADKACVWCDFRPVCGPHQEKRVKRKSDDKLGDLLELRSRP